MDCPLYFCGEDCLLDSRTHSPNREVRLTRGAPPWSRFGRVESSLPRLGLLAVPARRGVNTRGLPA